MVVNGYQRNVVWEHNAGLPSELADWCSRCDGSGSAVYSILAGLRYLLSGISFWLVMMLGAVMAWILGYPRSLQPDFPQLMD
ncbi:MAG: hypothetical protein AAGF98_09360 [Cyanobacteria bacterium P01_H01_bin.153]